METLRLELIVDGEVIINETIPAWQFDDRRAVLRKIGWWSCKPWEIICYRLSDQRERYNRLDDRQVHSLINDPIRNITYLSRRYGVSRTTIYRQLRKHGIKFDL